MSDQEKDRTGLAPPSRVVRLARVWTLQEAYLWRSLLEREGIPSRVVGDYLTDGFGVGVPGMCPEVWVCDHHLDKARRILRSRQVGENLSDA
jgi:hypothetical protein